MAGYRSTESKYKGGADEKYVTYDIEQKTRGDNMTTYPKVKRVYIAGNVKGWKVGHFRKRSGREVFGVKIDYQQSRASYRRGAYEAQRGGKTYHVDASKVPAATSSFTQIVEVPETARHVHFYDRDLPENYRTALQNVR